MRHSFWIRFFGRVLVGVILVLGPSARGTEAARGPEFFDQVAAHFDRWDADHDGRLSKAELFRLVDDPSVKGKEAAALAALVRVARGDKAWKADLSRDYLAGLGRAYPKRAANDPPFADLYRSGLRHLASTNRALFRDGDPSLHAFHQGTLGDCFVVAPLGAAVARDPAAVRKMIHARPDGSYRVTFGNGTAVDVPALTDAEIILSSASAGHGLWINVFEKAYAIDRNRQTPGGQKAASVLEAISHGGPPARAIEVFTGHKVRSDRIRNDKDPPPTGPAQSAGADRVGRELREATAARRLACAISASKHTTPGLPTHHVYAVLGYDATRHSVRLWNPHGNTFEPKGPAGLANGYPTRDGFFAMPLDDFVRVFVFVAVEEGR